MIPENDDIGMVAINANNLIININNNQKQTSDTNKGVKFQDGSTAKPNVNEDHNTRQMYSQESENKQ